MKLFQGASDNRIHLKPDEKLVIDQLLSPQPQTRIGLSESLGVSPAWITKTLQPLIARNLVDEYGNAEKSGGRRARLLGISRDVGYVIGLDLGLESLKIGISDLNVNNLSFKKVLYEADLADESRSHFPTEFVLSFLQDLGLGVEDVRSMGLCFSETVGVSEGENLPGQPPNAWEGNPFIKQLHEQFPLSLLVIDRDVSMMTLAEQVFGRGQNVPNFIFVKIGNSISAGIICQGCIYQGASGTAGDIGHVIIDEGGPECQCGKRGCLEAVAGGRAIASQAYKLAISGESKLLSKRLAQHGHRLNAIDVGEAAAQGDLASLELIDQCGEYVGKALTDMVRFYNPDSVIIGGDISNIGHRFLNIIRQVVLEEASPMATRNLRIEYSQLGERAGIMGAIKMAQCALFVEKSD